MPSERDVKLGVKDGAICSATGRPCKCETDTGCSPRLGKSAVDPLPREMVRWLRTARLHLEATNDALDNVHGDYEIKRAFPGPEVREVRRKVVTAIAMLDELGGEL